MIAAVAVEATSMTCNRDKSCGWRNGQRTHRFHNHIGDIVATVLQSNRISIVVSGSFGNIGHTSRTADGELVAGGQSHFGRFAVCNLIGRCSSLHCIFGIAMRRAIISPFLIVRGDIYFHCIRNNHQSTIMGSNIEPAGADCCIIVSSRHNGSTAEAIGINTYIHLFARIGRNGSDMVGSVGNCDGGHAARAGIYSAVVFHRKLAHRVLIAIVHNCVPVGFQHECQRLDGQCTRLRGHRVVPKVYLGRISRDGVRARHRINRSSRADYWLSMERQRVFQICLIVIDSKIRQSVFPSCRIRLTELARHVIRSEGTFRLGNGKCSIGCAHDIVSQTGVRTAHRSVVERVGIYAHIHRSSKIGVVETFAHSETIATGLFHDGGGGQFCTVIHFLAIVGLQVQRARRDLQGAEIGGNCTFIVDAA